MSYCPNCRAEVAADAPSCNECDALFSDIGWRPVDERVSAKLPAEKTSAAGFILKIGIASVVIPAIGLLIGIIFIWLVPDCQCDEGSGCRGCGVNDFVSFCLFGGFVGALSGIFTIFPGCLVLSLIVRTLSGRYK